MSELRFDILSGNFAIIATERAKRPSDWKTAQESHGEVSAFDPGCPFCPGNERMTPPEVYALRGDTQADGPGWRVRVVPNKFPALVDPGDLRDDPEPKAPRIPGEIPEDLDTAMYWRTPGAGTHEVVVESTSHNATIGSYHKTHLEAVLGVLRQRLLVLYDRKEVKYVQVFKNHGHRGGASLAHPHFQVIGMPVLPGLLATEGMRQRDYEARTGRCLVCDMVERELEKGVRVVSESSEFVVLSPFAARHAFETLILPRRHTASLVEFGEGERLALAEALIDLHARYEALFTSLPFNMVFHGMPDMAKGSRKWPYHAHIHVYPRLNTAAGLELGTGAYINPSPPELAARQLLSIEHA